MKINTNEETIKAIRQVIAEQDDNSTGVRIYIAGVGCSGPSFGLTLDKEGVEDVSNDEHGLTFYMKKTDYDQVGDMIVELTSGGYLVKPVNEVESACSSCAGSCG